MNTVSQQQVTVPFRELTDKQIRQYFSSTWPPGMIAGVIIISLGTFLLLASILALRFMTPIQAIGMILLAVIVIGLGVMIFRQSSRSRISDETYDEWLKRKAREIRDEAYSTLQIGQNDLRARFLFIHSFVLPGSSLADRQPEGTVLMKRGKDGNYRFSVNFYTFVFPFDRTIAVFTMYFNALTLSSRIWQNDEPPRDSILAVEIASSQEMAIIGNQPYDCALYRVCLQISRGGSCKLGAYLMAVPAASRNEAAITLSGTDMHQILGRVRKMLRSY